MKAIGLGLVAIGASIIGAAGLIVGGMGNRVSPNNAFIVNLSVSIICICLIAILLCAAKKWNNDRQKIQ